MSASERTRLAAGLISGTSADGIDAALIEVDGAVVRTLATCRQDLPEGFAATMAAVREQPGNVDLDALLAADAELGRAFAETVVLLAASADVPLDRIAVVGSHGQTVLHRPDADPPLTLQIGDPNRIAAALSIPVAADFRRADMAEGGEGAPLAPLYHQAVLSHEKEARGVLNLGGIANLTGLVPGAELSGFDTGPANGLMDAWIGEARGEAYDDDGAWAASAAPDRALLSRLLDDDWFRRPPPKSTGRERFSLNWLKGHLSGDEDPAAVQSTLAQLTVETVAWAVDAWLPEIRRLLVCGGGVENTELMRRLFERLPDVRLESTEAHGMDPAFVEAATFAWLALRTLDGVATDTRSLTGARRPVVLGALYGEVGSGD